IICVDRDTASRCVREPLHHFRKAASQTPHIHRIQRDIGVVQCTRRTAELSGKIVRRLQTSGAESVTGAAWPCRRRERKTRRKPDESLSAGHTFKVACDGLKRVRCRNRLTYG